MNSLDSNPIAILGGSGKAGRPLVQQALRAGYRVRLLLRHPERFEFQHERLEIISGDVRQPEAIQNLLMDCGALLSTLGHPKGEETPIIGPVTSQLLPALREAGIRRYVVVTSLYDTETEQQDPTTREAAAYMRQHYPQFMADRQREFRMLLESDLDWTYVRIPYLVQTPGTGAIGVSLEHLPGQQITGEDLADFLLDQIDSREYLRKAPFVASPLKR